MKRRVPQVIRQAIIKIAFNSSTEFTEIKNNPGKIGRLFGLNRNTVRAIIYAFIKHGKDFDNIIDRRHIKRNNFSLFE